MKKLPEDVRASLNDCFAHFFENSTGLESVDFGSYVQSSEEADVLFRALGSSESMKSIHTINAPNSKTEPSQDVVDSFAELIQQTTSLKSLDITKKSFSVAHFVQTLEALNESESTKTIEDTPVIDKECYKHDDVVSQLAVFYERSQNVLKLDLSGKSLNASQTALLLGAYAKSGSIASCQALPIVDKAHYQDESVLSELENIIKLTQKLKTLDLSKKALSEDMTAKLLLATAQSQNITSIESIPVIDKQYYQVERVWTYLSSIV